MSQIVSATYKIALESGLRLIREFLLLWYSTKVAIIIWPVWLIGLAQSQGTAYTRVRLILENLRYCIHICHYRYTLMYKVVDAN